ncbi:MAG: hypothetical protein NVS4B3_16230 [Gemmatimonadaceae bacterium]
MDATSARIAMTHLPRTVPFRSRISCAAALLCSFAPVLLDAQGVVAAGQRAHVVGRPLSLEEAVATAERQSATVRIAESAVLRARGG